ncbi:hypothetical protein Bca101_049838 [Brassica carinata]
MMAFRVDRSSSVFSFGGLVGLLSFSFKTKSLLLCIEEMIFYLRPWKGTMFCSMYTYSDERPMVADVIRSSLPLLSFHVFLDACFNP